MDAAEDTDSNWLVALDKSLAAQILRAIILDFQADRVAPARTTQLVLDTAQEILGLLIVDVEIAIARNAERVDSIENQTGE